MSQYDVFFLSLREFGNNTLVRPFKRFKSHGFRCHRLRHENLHNFEKNLDQNGLLRKKLEHFEIGQLKILRSKNLQNVHRNFHWKLYENENFRDRKFPIFSDRFFSTGFSMKISMKSF